LESIYVPFLGHYVQRTAHMPRIDTIDLSNFITNVFFYKILACSK